MPDDFRWKKRSLVGNLNDGGASGDGLVGHGLVAASQDNVGLAGEALGDLDLEATLDGLGLDKGRASDGDEGSIDLLAFLTLDSVVLQESNC